MNNHPHSTRRHFLNPKPGSVLLALVIAGASMLQVAAEAPATSKHEHQAADGKAKSGLEDQLSELRTEVARLQAALGADHQGSDTNTAGSSNSHGTASSSDGMAKDKGMDMKGMMKGMEMGMMKGMDMGMMKAMRMKGMDMGGDGKKMGMSLMKQGMGMGHLSKMGRAPDAALQVSALPGFPGASHLYHIGATGFFLDHLEHLKLSKAQQGELNGIKEDALLQQREHDRELEKTEEDLWKLTAADSPDASAIAKTLRKVGDLTVEQRLEFIQAVGLAAKVLTEEQRKILGGTAESSGDDQHKH